MSRRRGNDRTRTPDQLRRRRRRRLLGWTSPLWIAAVVVGLRLVTTPATVAGARAAYDDGQFSTAASDYSGLQGFPPVERWKAYFDAGTAYYQDERIWEAYDDLEVALDLAPDEALCMVQTNVALATEAVGDTVADYAADELAEAADVRVALAAREAGEPYDAAVLDPYGDGTEPDPDELEASSRSDSSFAESLYSDAAEVRERPGCEQQSDAAAAASAEAQDRLDEKEQAAAAAAADPADAEEPAASPTGSPEEQEAARQAALAERNAEAANGREQELQQDESDGDGTGGGTDQNW